MLQHLARLGYARLPRDLRLRAAPATGSACTGISDGRTHLLVEAILEKRRCLGVQVLYVHWLSLRDPRAHFSDRRPRLPGQEVPGLGLARESATMLARMAVRLGLGGVAFRPSQYHLAFTARHSFTFVDPERQGRFEALVRDLGRLPLLEVTRAVAEGRVLLNGQPYAWEADEMVFWLRESPSEPGEVEREAGRVRFTPAPGAAPAAPPPRVRTARPPPTRPSGPSGGAGG